MKFCISLPASYDFQKTVTMALVSLSLSACATLPSSGPTGKQIQSSILKADNGSDIQLIELVDAASLPVQRTPARVTLTDLPPPPTDMVGPGDILDIAIYESGVTLFGAAGKTSVDGTTFDTSAKVERLSGNRVDDAGNIQVPYAGRLHVAGLTAGEIEGRIRGALRGYSQNPQVLVAIREMITNSVILGGEVNRPGRLVLPTNRENVLDAIALAGGYRGEVKDLSVRLQRSNVTEEFRLGELVNGEQDALRLYPGDRISILRAPRTFSVMGAPGRVELFTFAASKISMAEAVAQAGGPNANFGDPEAIFVFRYVVTDGIAQPMVYHMNMMTAGAYLLAQRFAMHDKDVLYIGNARANQPSKLIQIISQLFSPIVTATSAVQVLKN